eukprot:20686-Karenia_brevis.AAC.1
MENSLPGFAARGVSNNNGCPTVPALSRSNHLGKGARGLRWVRTLYTMNRRCSYIVIDVVIGR